jgi:hypothetical protein
MQLTEVERAHGLLVTTIVMAVLFIVWAVV